MFETFVGLFGLDEEYYADRLFDLVESLFGASPGEFGLTGSLNISRRRR